MSVYLKCPLCGLNSHLNRFNPEELQEIIELIEMRSQGRARGWKVVDRFSALGDDDLMEKIANRCHVILKIIGEEVPEKSEDTNLVTQLREENAELQTSVDDYEEEMDGILAKLNRVLIKVYEGEFSTLEKAAEALIVEYREAMEESEDADEEEDDVVLEDDTDFESLSPLDKELLIFEREEARAEKESDDGF